MCGCNMMDDGIDMDVLKSLPGKFIKKIAYHSNVPMDSYNDALKQAIKARAKSSSTNVRQFLTGIPGVEAEIIKIEKMKEGGNLYAPYPKKAQGPFGPKHIDSKTMLSTYAEGQDKKTKEQYRTDMLSPMMQEGGSILNDVGKEHLIIPRNQGTELNIPKYIQAYVQATTNMGKYQDGGALGALAEGAGGMEGLGGIMQSMGGIGGILKTVTDLSAGFKKPEKPRDPNEPPLTRFSKGGVSEAMNFYIQRYPGYGQGVKEKYKNGGVSKFQDGKKVVLEGVTLTDEQAKAYNNLKSKYKGTIRILLGSEEESGGKSLPGLTYQDGSKSLDFYDGDNYLGSISYDLKQTEQKQVKIGSVNTPKKEQQTETKSNKELQLQKEKDWLQNNPYINPELNSMQERYQKEQLERKAMLAQEDQAQKDLEAQKRHNEMLKRRDSETTSKSTTQPAKKLKLIKSVDVSNLESITKGGQEYKVDPSKGIVYTTDGKTITDKTFVKNILADAPGKQIKVIEPTKVNLQVQASEDLNTNTSGVGEYANNIMETRAKSLLAQRTPEVIVDTSSQGRQASDKTRNKLVDFFTRTDEEKEEKRKRRLNRK